MNVKNSYTEITRTSWISRVGQSFVGAIFAVLILVGANYLLYWNEGRAINTAKSLDEGAGSVISVDFNSVDSINQGKLVHGIGELRTNEMLNDTEFGISINALRLIRKVEMYQWQENKREKKQSNLDGSADSRTNYHYQKKWLSSVHSSKRFKIREGHENPDAMRFKGLNRVANDAMLGQFKFPPRLISQMENFEKIYVNPSMVQQLPANLRAEAKENDGAFYFGDNPSEPAVGDLRVWFEIVKPTRISLVAMQNGGSFEPYMTKVGKSIELIEVGDHTAAAMFKVAQDKNRMWTWGLRAVGFTFMLMAFGMLFNPIKTLASIVPFFGDLVAMGTSFLAMTCAFTVTFINIALSWIRFRPNVGGVILAIGVAIFFYARSRAKKQIV